MTLDTTGVEGMGGLRGLVHSFEMTAEAMAIGRLADGVADVGRAAAGCDQEERAGKDGGAFHGANLGGVWFAYQGRLAITRLVK
jgi:hypothetical protein